MIKLFGHISHAGDEHPVGCVLGVILQECGVQAKSVASGVWDLAGARYEHQWPIASLLDRRAHDRGGDAAQQSDPNEVSNSS